MAPKVSLSDSFLVLVLARDELISALLGLLIEFTGNGPVFANDRESSEAAILRLRPNVIVVDCDHRDCRDDLVEAARQVGARLIVFSASREVDYVKRVAAPWRSESFTFPIEPPQLDSLIRQHHA